MNNGKYYRCFTLFFLSLYHSLLSVSFVLLENDTTSNFAFSPPSCQPRKALSSGDALNIYLVKQCKKSESQERFEDKILLLPRHLSATLHLEIVLSMTTDDVRQMFLNGTLLANGVQDTVDLQTKSKGSSHRYYDEVARSISHLKAIQQAFSNGLVTALIVEEDAVLTRSFLENWKNYLQFAPVDWTVLQWTTNNPAVNKKESHRSNDYWLSWSGHHSSTIAYTINREGMRRILRRTSNIFTKKENRSIHWRFDESNLLIADEIIYMAAGNAYTSSYGWFLLRKPRNFSLGELSAKFDQSEHVPGIEQFQNVERPESIAIIQNVRLRNTQEIQEEARRLNADVRALTRFNPHSYWFVKIVLIRSDLLPMFHQTFLQCPNDNVQFEVEVSKNLFNKFIFVHKKLHVLTRFDNLLLKDNDIRLAGFEWNTFLNTKNDSLISAPYRVDTEGLTCRQREKIRGSKNSTNYTVELQDGRLFNTPLDKDFQNVRGNPVMALEMFMVLMKSDFALWFFKRALTREFLSQNVSWGPDLIWCGAAHDFLKNTNKSSEKAPLPCSLVTVNVIHLNTKQIQKSKNFVLGGVKALEIFKKDSLTKNWIKENSSSRYYYHALSDWCKRKTKKKRIADCLKEFQLRKIEKYSLSRQRNL